MSQQLFLNRIFSNLLLNNILNYSNNNSKEYNNLTSYLPNDSQHLTKGYYYPLFYNQKLFLNECIQHTPYSNLIKGNIDKPCTSLHCKYKKIIL